MPMALALNQGNNGEFADYERAVVPSTSTISNPPGTIEMEAEWDNPITSMVLAPNQGTNVVPVNYEFAFLPETPTLSNPLAAVSASRAASGTQHRVQKRQTTSRKRAIKSRFQETSLPGYMCFSSVTGAMTSRPRRAAFTRKRREEVRQVRKLGACLRCQLRKRTCSGGDPCKHTLNLEYLAGWNTFVLRSRRCPYSPHVQTQDLTFSSLVTRVQLRAVPQPEPNLTFDDEMTIQTIVSEILDMEFKTWWLTRYYDQDYLLNQTLGQEKSAHLKLLFFLTCNHLSQEANTQDQRQKLEESREKCYYVANMALKDLETRLRSARLENSRAGSHHVRFRRT
ncbi:hypothetical protein K458DRAFT_398741 [Lentithecium fluviatile CBS 122367]|uniref:Uncharacterized protein n=1 Tax=Lentithecium fluviatile CBS 122367 TaxID=1168545 RepID=A0A6G1JJZ9_9PLEO|nr:hypothetical protein K458DRAFT_398741 [Lentithecium fluviatile CBS 122367]